MKDPKEIGRHVFCFNPEDNGREAFLLVTSIHNDGDDNYVHQELNLYSCCNCAGFSLCGDYFSPDKLRQLTNELEKFYNKNL